MILDKHKSIYVDKGRNLLGGNVITVTISYKNPIKPDKIFCKTDGTPWMEKCWYYFKEAGNGSKVILNEICSYHGVEVPKE